jgi:hypothetical protein
MSELDPGRVLAAVARAAGIDVATLSRCVRPLPRSGPGRGGAIPHPHTAVRIAAAWMLRHRCGLTYLEIGRRLRCTHVSAIRLIVRADVVERARDLVTAVDRAMVRVVVDVDAELRRAREAASGPGYTRRP